MLFFERHYFTLNSDTQIVIALCAEYSNIYSQGGQQWIVVGNI